MPAKSGDGMAWVRRPSRVPCASAILAAAHYMNPMKTVLAILVAILMFATLAVLLAGLFSLARSNHDPARSNRLMRWRIILQGSALLLFMLLMSLLRS